MSPTEAVRSGSRSRPIRRLIGLSALLLAVGLGTSALGVATAGEPRRVDDRGRAVARDAVDGARGVSPRRRQKPSAVRVVRELYAALSAGNVPGVVARLHPDVVVDEPRELPWGGVTYGRDAYVATVLGGLTRAAAITITESRVYSGVGGRVVGQLIGTLTAHTTGERYPVTFIELHQVKDGTVRRMDIYLKDPAGLAAFVARSAAAAN